VIPHVNTLSLMFTCNIRLEGSVRPFQDLSYASLERLEPEQWFNDDLVNTGIRCASFLLTQACSYLSLAIGV
jgi:hypothetical protein